MAVRKMRTGYQIRFTFGGSRSEVYVPRINKRQAEDIERRITSIASSVDAGIERTPEDSRWIAGISDNLHSKLESRGLVGPRIKEESLPAKLLNFNSAREMFDEQYHASSKTVEQVTLAHNSFAKYLEAKGLDGDRLEDLGESVALGFRAHLLKAGKAEATTRKACSRVKQLFTWAVRSKLISSNPFDSVPVSSIANKLILQKPVDAELIKRVIEKIDCQDARMVLALCRFAGFRWNETAWTTWNDVDFEEGWITVRSSKTGSRRCPLFASLLPYLEAMPAGSRKGPLQSRWPADANPRTTMRRMILATGEPLWDGAILHSLRKSKATELLDHLPPQTVASYLGHDVRVLMQHYALQQDANAEKARRLL